MTISTYLSISTLNVNGLNAPTERKRLDECVQKQDPYICCQQEIHFRSKDTIRLKVRECNKILHANGNYRKTGVALYISHKIDVKIKKVTRYKARYYIMIKGSI